MAVVFSDGVALEDQADREAWCEANLPAYNTTHPPPAGFAPAPGPGMHQAAAAPLHEHGGLSPAGAPRLAPALSYGLDVLICAGTVEQMLLHSLAAE